MPLRVIRVEERVVRHPTDHLAELPAEVHGVLEAEPDTLPARRGVHVCRVAREQHAARAVRRGLAGGVGEPRQPRGVAHAEVRAEHLDQAPPQVVEGGLVGRRRRLGQHHAHGAVVRPVEAVRAALVDGPGALQVPVHLDVGDEGGAGRVRTDEVDAGGPPHDAATAVGAHDVSRPHRVARTEQHVDAVVVLHHALDLDAAPDRDAHLLGPREEQPLDAVLEQRQRVRVARGQARQGEARAAERHRGDRGPLGEEPVGDAALVEQLDRAGVDPAAARADEVLRVASLEDDDVRPREAQLARQHEPRRAAADHRHVVHREPPASLA
ncbi:hypothetical protein GCM10027054_25240 [Isoptericola nanjingensis]